MVKNKKYINKIDRSRKNKPKNEFVIDLKGDGCLSIKVSKNPNVLNQIIEVIKWLPLQEGITDNDIKNKTKEIYDILIQDEESNEWKISTAKQVDNYLIKMDKLTDELKKISQELPIEAVECLLDSEDLIITGDSDVFSVRQIYNTFIDIDHLNRVRVLLDRAMKKNKENSKLSKRGKKTDLYLEFIAKKFAFIFLELTGKMPTREIHDDINKQNKQSLYGEFLEKIFEIGDIKASATYCTRLSVEHLQKFYGVNSQKKKQ